MTFDDLWKIYPHYESRSKKAVSRGLFDLITTVGRSTKIDGVPLQLKADPQAIVDAARSYREDTDRDYTKSYTENRQYVPGLQVWLNQGRWEDWEKEEKVSHLHLTG